MYVCFKCGSLCHLINFTLFKLLFQSDENKVDLFNDKGFDDFLNLLESSLLSKNPNYYGSLHNNGHVSVYLKNAIDKDIRLTIICMNIASD